MLVHPFRYYYFDEDVNVTKPDIQRQFITTDRVLPPKFLRISSR